jgi:hypothetical protein
MKIKVEVVGMCGRGPMLALRPKDKPQAWLELLKFESPEARKKLYPGAPYWTEIELPDELADELKWS